MNVSNDIIKRGYSSVEDSDRWLCYTNMPVAEYINKKERQGQLEISAGQDSAYWNMTRKLCRSVPLRV
jgi:hypothetical protein